MGVVFQEWRGTYDGCLLWRALAVAFTHVGTAARYSHWRSLLPFSRSLTCKVNTPEKAIFVLFISQKSSSLHVPDTIQNKQQNFVSCTETVCWSIKSYWWSLLKNVGLFQGHFKYSWGIIIDFSFLPTGIVLVISHCSCKARRLILLKSHLGSLHGRCCSM